MDNKKTISLGRKDALIKYWIIRIKNENEEDGMLSFLVKQALLYYIRYQDFVVISKIHFSKEDSNIITTDTNGKRMAINLWLSDYPEILEWIEQISQRGFKSSSLIREIIKKSILIAPDEEPEWFPTYCDFDMVSQLNKLSTLLKNTDSNNEEIKKTKSKIQEIPIQELPLEQRKDVQIKQENAIQVGEHDEHRKEKILSDKVQKKPRAMGLSGYSFQS